MHNNYYEEMKKTEVIYNNNYDENISTNYNSDSKSSFETEDQEKIIENENFEAEDSEREYDFNDCNAQINNKRKVNYHKISNLNDLNYDKNNTY